jgi:hypothetical protein
MRPRRIRLRAHICAVRLSIWLLLAAMTCIDEIRLHHTFSVYPHR